MTDSSSAANPKARRTGLLALSALVVVAGIAWAGYEFAFSHDESTNDAYVGGDVVQITSEIAGTVSALHADDTQSVQQGQLLIEFDPSDAKVAMASAEARLAQAVRQVGALFAQADQYRAQIAAREADLKRARDDASRRSALVASGAVSREDFAHAQDTTASLSAALAAAQAALNQTLAQIRGTQIASHPEVLTAAAAVRDAALKLQRTKVNAPISGVVAKRNVQLGQHVDRGSPLMAVVSLGDVWIDANFKEVQLEEMRVGQPVTIKTDIYGSDVVYHGKVAGVSAGSGSAFSLLPAQNATGNWIKIVQRVPVRILLDPAEIKAHPLRIGLSAKVDVDVSDTSGPLVATEVRSQPFPTRRTDANDPAVDALIAKIIAENGGAESLAAAGGH